MIYQENIKKALQLCHDAYTGVFRKGSGLPYIVHPVEVLVTVCRWGVNNVDVWTAALCHDSVEERPDLITAQLLEQEIGKKAADYVMELTFIPSDPASKEKSKLEKEAYMASFGTKSVESVLIKIADRYHNSLDFHNSDDWKYAPIYYRKALPVLDLLVHRKKEFIDRFGIDTIERINSDLANLEDKLFS